MNIAATVRDMNNDGFPDVQISKSVDVEPGFDLVSLVSQTRPIFKRTLWGFGPIERCDDPSTSCYDLTKLREIGKEFAGYKRVE